MHAVWHCSFFASSRPPCLGDALQRRLGWPSGTACDEQVISHMAHAREVLLSEAQKRGWVCSGGSRGGVASTPAGTQVT